MKKPLITLVGILAGISVIGGYFFPMKSDSLNPVVSSTTVPRATSISTVSAEPKEAVETIKATPTVKPTPKPTPVKKVSTIWESSGVDLNGYAVVGGTVQNSGEVEVSNVKVTVTFYNSKGTQLGKAYMYAGETTKKPLLPKQTAEFKVSSSPRVADVKKYNIEIAWE